MFSRLPYQVLVNGFCRIQLVLKCLHIEVGIGVFFCQQQERFEIGLDFLQEPQRPGLVLLQLDLFDFQIKGLTELTEF